MGWHFKTRTGKEATKPEIRKSPKSKLFWEKQSYIFRPSRGWRTWKRSRLTTTESTQYNHLPSRWVWSRIWLFNLVPTCLQGISNLEEISLRWNPIQTIAGFAFAGCQYPHAFCSCSKVFHLVLLFNSRQLCSLFLSMTILYSRNEKCVPDLPWVQ